MICGWFIKCMPLVTRNQITVWWLPPILVRAVSDFKEVLTRFFQSEVKNITYCKWHFSIIYYDTYNLSDLAKISPHILNPERFALHLATFLVSKYPHIGKAFVTVEQLRWSRICLTQDKQSGHPHSFHRDGNDKRVVKVEVTTFNQSYVNMFLFVVIM
jgi:hypothetical protein